MCIFADVLVVCGTHGEWATRGWMLWEIWFAAFTCGRAALHFVAAGGRCAARDLALYAQRIDLSAAAWSGPGDALKMKEWCESARVYVCVCVCMCVRAHDHGTLPPSWTRVRVSEARSFL